KTDISEDYWLTDITLSHNSWCYIDGQTYKAPSLVIRNMIDVWSKKGVVLLNISPKAGGTGNEEQRNIIATNGQRMEKQKEAIFETRAHNVYGYGEAQFEKGHFGGQSATMAYTEKDIRFTTSRDKKYLYVFVLGMPQPNSPLDIVTDLKSEIKKVSVVGSKTDVAWSMTDNGLRLTTPDSSDMDELATVFKIEFE